MLTPLKLIIPALIMMSCCLFSISKKTYASYRANNLIDAYIEQRISELNATAVKNHPIRSSANFVTIQLGGSPDAGYYFPVSIGNKDYQHGQMINVIVDSGSTSLVIADQIPCGSRRTFNHSLSSTFTDQHLPSSVTYSTGSARGTLAQDQIHFRFGHSVNTSFIAANQVSDFCDGDGSWSGIMGLAYPSISLPNPSVKAVTDLIAKANNWNNILIFHFCQEDYNGYYRGGTLTFGQDPGAGNFVYTPVIQKGFFEVQVQGLAVGQSHVDADCNSIRKSATIVDTGTTNLFFHEELFNQISSAFQDETAETEIPSDFWSGDYLLGWPDRQRKTLFSLLPVFNITLRGYQGASDFTLVVTPAEYLQKELCCKKTLIDPRNCTLFCGDYWGLAILVRPCGNILGSRMMTGFDTVLDKEQNRVGFKINHHCHNTFYDGRLAIEATNQSTNYTCGSSDCVDPPVEWEKIFFYVTSSIAVLVVITLTSVMAYIKRDKIKELGKVYCLCCLISNHHPYYQMPDFFQTTMDAPIQETINNNEVNIQETEL